MSIPIIPATNAVPFPTTNSISQESISTKSAPPTTHHKILAAIQVPSDEDVLWKEVRESQDGFQKRIHDFLDFLSRR